MNTEQVRAKAVEIVQSSRGLAPNDMLAALGIAAGTLIVTCWPTDKHEACFEAHDDNVRSAVKACALKLRRQG
jgi:hypothetical protein